MKSALFTAAGVIALALALSGSHLLGPDDIQAEADQSEDMTAAAQRSQALVTCRQAYGANALTFDLPDGSLVCRRAPAAVAQRSSL